MDIGEANTGSCKLTILLIEVQKAFSLKLNLSGKSLFLSQALKQKCAQSVQGTARRLM